ncbi:MAG: uroporphyrinogen-III C-methyltransferase [Gammaproteobacteria bacterium]|nr:uroporphyrinogen-III C-methyltransferase [Gammaproteobacteria bacterium]
MSETRLPLLFDLRGRRVLIVGGGSVALRRARTLLAHGLKVKVVAPEIRTELRRLLGEGGGRIDKTEFRPEHIAKNDFVIAATRDTTVNQQVAACARAAGIPVNVADDPQASDFVFPSILERGPLSIAIAGGGSPVLTRLLRRRLEALVPAGYGVLATLAAKYRDAARRGISDRERRTTFWEKILQGRVVDAALAGRGEEAEVLLQQALRAADPLAMPGEVFLVGAGPGDPGLLTLRAFDLLQRADIVLYDRLVADAVLALVNPAAERVYVGKRRAEHAVPQPEINQLLVTYARQGKRVVRLKGGDPFIFGRGGEEIERLCEERIPFQVIPGITAASGCASYAGIPLTHRDHAQSVRFLPGQLREGTIDLPWRELVQPGQTLVIYMALTGLPVIRDQLLRHGMDPATPVALVERGTLPEQRVTTASLSSILQALAAHEPVAPSLLIVGSVVALRARLFGV